MMSRLDNIIITFFDPAKTKRYNMRLNQYFATRWGVKIDFEIMKWSERMLAHCMNMRQVCKMMNYRIRWFSNCNYIILYDIISIYVIAIWWFENHIQFIIASWWWNFISRFAKERFEIAFECIKMHSQNAFPKCIRILQNASKCILKC